MKIQKGYEKKTCPLVNYINVKLDIEYFHILVFNQKDVVDLEMNVIMATVKQINVTV